MNNKSLDALFTGLTGTTQQQPAKQSPVRREQETHAVKEASAKQQQEEKVAEERFCSIVQSELLNKIRIIAKRERLQIKDVVNAAFDKAIKSYERKHGRIDDGVKGDVNNLF